MAAVIRTKRNATVAAAPTTLAFGELAVNPTDVKLWVGNAANAPVLLNPSSGGGGGGLTFMQALIITSWGF